MFVRTLVLALVANLALTSGCEITVKNVGLKTFTWRISYAGVEGHSKELQPGESENHACTCLPHDMYVDYEDIYCYHYMNCINKNQYQVEVGEYAIYINVGNKNVETCVL
ncbi:uncharacterized protein LOC131881511 [Tigriopus californicus]|uniref:uncharacterized protein LOC131881511 n=1 Tax=Tigriopus californicus TaxID=6832 RepID=UPI0027DA373D|nr:uncharacterized protein LOC131881511 [Tigriopus californicus]